MKLIEDRPCEICGEFCESVKVEQVVSGTHRFECPNCNEENIYFSDMGVW